MTSPVKYRNEKVSVLIDAAIMIGPKTGERYIFRDNDDAF